MPGSTVQLRIVMLAVAALIVEVYAVAPFLLPGREFVALATSGRNEQLIWDFGEGAPVTQTFVPPPEEIETVELVLRSEGPRSVTVLAEIATDEPGQMIPVHRSTTRLQLDGRRVYRLEIPAGLSVAGSTARLTLERAAGESGRVALEAWQENALRPGALIVGGREVWGDLRMRILSTPRIRYGAGAIRDWPAWSRHPALLVALLGFLNWSVMTLAQALVGRRRSS